MSETLHGQSRYTVLRSRWIAVLLTILLAAALRLYHLGFHSLWYDEAFTAWVAAQTPRDAVWLCLQDVVHPPLYYILALVWTRLVGNTEFALRAVSAGLGLLGVPLLYQLGRRGCNHRVGLAGAGGADPPGTLLSHPGHPPRDRPRAFFGRK